MNNVMILVYRVTKYNSCAIWAERKNIETTFFSNYSRKNIVKYNFIRMSMKEIRKDFKIKIYNYSLEKKNIFSKPKYVLNYSVVV